MTHQSEKEPPLQQKLEDQFNEVELRQLETTPSSSGVSTMPNTTTATTVPSSVSIPVTTSNGTAGGKPAGAPNHTHVVDVQPPPSPLSDRSTGSQDQHNDISNFIQEERDQREVAREKRMKEKLVYVISVVSLVLLAYGVLQFHWMLPYYYTVSMPALIILRAVIYWKHKYQYFLLDFCYFGNIFCFVYIWAFPGQPEVFAVMFGLANGPLAWAVVLFRNSAVFHDYDRMTSIYIHVLPMFIVYCGRWYPESISLYWYTPFSDSFNEEVGYMFIWLAAVPFAIFIFHAVMYIVMVYCVCRPGPEYLYSFNYLSAKENSGCTGRCISCCGRNKTKIGKLISYSGITATYGVLSLMVLPLWWKYFICHTVYMAGICIIVIFNGAGYYMDVFAKKGFIRA